jgi:hypothetical protein
LPPRLFVSAALTSVDLQDRREFAIIALGLLDMAGPAELSGALQVGETALHHLQGVRILDGDQPGDVACCQPIDLAACIRASTRDAWT